MKEDIQNICCEVNKHPDIFVPMSPEIVQTSSFYFSKYEDFMAMSNDEKNNYVYTRGSNPTTKELEKKLARLENGEKCKVFSSGMGAISSTIFTLVSQGDHILVVNTIYGEALAYFKYLKKFGISVDVANIKTATELDKFIRDNTKLIYFESPSSQKFELLDIEYVTKLARSKNIYTVIDSTWNSPLFQTPLNYNVDIVIHSLSKYVGGHSDLVGGAIIGNEKLVDKIFENGHQTLGSTISPFNSWLALRGLRTLAVRMEYQSTSIKKVLSELNKDPRISHIFHPYLSDDYQQALANKYLSGYGSLFAIDLADDDFDKLKIFVNSLKIISIGVSWGGFESLALPAFKGNNLNNLNKRGLAKTHIRFYLGLEEPESIIDDIKQALDIAYYKI